MAAKRRASLGARQALPRGGVVREFARVASGARLGAGAVVRLKTRSALETTIGERHWGILAEFALYAYFIFTCEIRQIE